jgi:hypothetical protein
MRTDRKFRWLGRVLLGLAAAACLTPAEPLHAQTRIEDPESARDTKRAATAAFLDRNRPEEERLEALKAIGYPEDRTFAALHALGTDRSQSDTIRLEALKRLQFDGKYLDAVLNILEDPKDGGEDLDAGLVEDLNRRATVTPPAQVRQRLQSVFRKLLHDKRDKVRLHAYRAAVSNHDLVAVNILAESLRNGQNVPIPLADAIDLLDFDGAVNHIGTLRPYLHHEDPRVQAKAARALAVDPESRPAIVQMARNPRAPEEVRLNALRSLAREDSQFGSYAIPLVEDVREDASIRYAAMHAFVGRMNYNQVAPAEQLRFAQAVEKLAVEKDLRTAEARQLHESAQELREYLKQAFPEIRTFHERR